jgi:apolipoprotein N-acyltransferase
MNKFASNILVSYLLAAISGLLMMLSMPGYDLWYLAWFGLVPVLLALRGKSAAHQYFLINVTSVIWSVGTHWWYPSIFSSWGYLIMVAGGLFYGGILKMGYDMSRRIGGWYSIFSIPVAFSVLEWVKTVIPVTKTWWIELVSKSQWTVPENLQILSSTGFIGLSFLILLTNAIIARLIERGEGEKRGSLALAALLLLPILNYSYGSVLLQNSKAMLSSSPITIGATVDLINQDPEVIALGSAEFAGDGYLADTEEMKRKIFEINSDLSRRIQTEKKANFIVWGENEFMNLNDTRLYEQFAGLAQELNAAIVADTVWETGDAMYDTAVMVSASGEEIGRTPKIFTLWGEEEYGFSPGPRTYSVYDTEFGKAALAVCWDRHDASILRHYALQGAKLAFIPADDDFYGNGRFPWFAASDAVFRAVENHLAIGSGSTSGVAQVITPYGEMTAKSSVNRREYIVGDTFVAESETFHTKYGDVFAYLLSGCFIAMLAASERNKRRAN